MNKTRLSAFRWEDTRLNAHLRSFVYNQCLSRSLHELNTLTFLTFHCGIHSKSTRLRCCYGVLIKFVVSSLWARRSANIILATTTERLFQLRRYASAWLCYLVVDEVQRGGYNGSLGIGNERAHNAGGEATTAPAPTAGPGSTRHQRRCRSRSQHYRADISGRGQRGKRGHQG